MSQLARLLARQAAQAAQAARPAAAAPALSASVSASTPAAMHMLASSPLATAALSAAARSPLSRLRWLSSSPKSLATSDRKPPSGAGAGSGAGDSDGMDLFAQAMAAQKRQQEQQEQQQGQQGQQGQQQEQQQEQQSTDAEAERARRMNESMEKEEEERKAKNKPFYYAVTAASLLGMYAFAGMPTEKDTGKDDESYLTGHNRRVAAYWTDTYEYWINPPSKKLLPDPLPAPYHRPYTILIELTDAMTHLVWDREVGWRAAVRPGVKHFLANIGRHFEIVMFTTSPHHLADPIVNALDPYGYIMYRLYREHTKLVDGKYVKDLTLLNRDLGKVIVLDTNPESYSLNPENGLHLNKWQGTAGDDEFERLEDFFEELSTMLNLLHTDDVRPLLGVLRKYDPEDPAGAWVKHKNLLRAEFERSAKAERAKTQASAAAASTTAAPSGSGSSSTGAAILSAVGSFVGTLAGKNRATGLMAGAGGQAPAAQTQQPTNFIDLIEQYAREDRKDFEKHYEEQIRQMEAARKEQEDAMRKQMEAMKSQKLTLMDYMSGAGQPPVPGQQPPQQQ